MIAGTNLNDPENATIVGINQGWYFKESATAVDFYLAVSENHQKQGIGDLLLKALNNRFDRIAQTHGTELKGLFIELNDPEKVSAEEDSMDPYARAAMYAKRDWLQVPVNYWQPATESVDETDYMHLISGKMSNGKHADLNAVKGFLKDYYASSDYESAEASDKYNGMIRELGDDMQYTPIKTLEIQETTLLPQHTSDY